MEISKEEITRMVQEAYIEGFNSAIECLKSAKDGVAQTFAAQQSVQRTGGESGQQNLFSTGEVLPAKVTRQTTRR